MVRPTEVEEFDHQQPSAPGGGRRTGPAPTRDAEASVTAPVADPEAVDGLDASATAPRVDRAVLAVTIVPFVVSAVALVFGVGGSYMPASDHAFTELHIRDVGVHELLYGLYSRNDWSHPGPVYFYLLAPLYRLTGNASIAMNIGALLINGGSVVGMGLIARRRGGTALMVATLLTSALMLRTAGAEWVHDPWNTFVTTLPFGLLMFLVWSMACGERWALPVGTFVATFLAQTHIGFVVLAVPLFAVGAAWLVVPALRPGAAPGRRRALVRPVALSAVVGGVLWLPPFIDILINEPNNLAKAIDWFRHADEIVHTPTEGFKVMVAQFAFLPEWANRKLSSLSGESPYLGSIPVPWLLIPATAAAVVLWRRRERGARELIGVLLVSGALGVVAIARTLGPAYDYRLRWTWVPAAITLAVVAWAVWLVATERWGRPARRALAVVGVGGLLVVSGINAVTAATAGTPQEGESAALQTLTPQVLDALGDVDGPVLVEDRYSIGVWFSRGLVLQLEKRGIEALVPPDRSAEFGKHRVYRGGPLAARLIVAQDDTIAKIATDRSLRRIAYWSSVSDEELGDYQRERRRLDADHDAGRLSDKVWGARSIALEQDIRTNGGSVVAYRVAFFLAEP